MDTLAHWEHLYTTRNPAEVSWYRPHLERSLSLIEAVSPDRAAALIDVGAGESTLIDDLLEQGYRHLTVLEISPQAIDAMRARLGDRAQSVRWIAADVTRAELAPLAYDLWHDRAVFHFLARPEQRTAYLRRLTHALKPGGHVVMSTFGPEGPTRCSGLEVVRYSAETLQAEFGPRFRMVNSSIDTHTTPSGRAQQFLCCCFQWQPSDGR